jgi:7-carboxy-7-deazaguanine synthase
MNSEKKIKITETFLSVQGEGQYSGYACFFIRFSGCDLRCTWCDTDYSWSGGNDRTIVEIVSEIPDWVPFIQITGGEPLLFKDQALELIKNIHQNKNGRILLETGGHRDLSGLPYYVHINMDIKLNSSGEYSENFAANLHALKKSDEIKFVAASEEDFFQAADIIKKYNLYDICEVIFSAARTETNFTPERLVKLLLENKITARMQLQLHKYIWNPEVRGV